MNSSFVSICVLMKSNLGERCLINTLMNMSSQALRFYLKHANIYDVNSNKKKADLLEMIVYGRITNQISKEPVKDITSNKVNNILREKNILIKSLPSYGNIGLRKKDIKPHVNE